MQKVFLRPLFSRLSTCLFLILCSFIGSPAALLALSTRPVNRLADILPATVVALLIFIGCLAVAVRALFWAYVVVEDEIRFRGLFWNSSYPANQIASIESFQRWEPKHHPPGYYFRGFILRDSSGAEIFRVVEIADFKGFEVEIVALIKRNGFGERVQTTT